MPKGTAGEGSFLRVQRVLGLALGITLLAVPAGARKDHARFTPPEGVLRVTTQLVQVNVIVKDRHGHLVPGLTRRDFSLFDDGKAQEISIFRVEAVHPAAAAALPKFPPGTFSNFSERQAGASPAVTAILLDDLNTPWANQARARMQVIKFLQQIQPGDHVALYALGGSLRILHDFSTDSSALVAALKHYKGRYASELQASQANSNSSDMIETSDLSSSDAAALQSWLDDSSNYMQDFYLKERVRMTVAALVAIANHLAGVPGRKNLIWVSGGFPLLHGLDATLGPSNFNHLGVFEQELSRAAQAFNQVSLAVYPVDARGLMVRPEFGARWRRRAPTRFTDLSANFSTMDQIAQRTGGRAFYETNDIKGALRKVVDDSRLTYVLGYYPRNVKWQGEYRKIKVQVDRPHLKLQYRRGYLAAVASPMHTPTARQAVTSAVYSPLDATSIGLAVRAQPMRAQHGSQLVLRLWYDIDAHDITFNPRGNVWIGGFTVTVAELGPRGEELKAKSYGMNFHCNSQKRQKYLADGFGAMGLFHLVPGGERVRVVVRDNTSAHLGSISIPLDRVLQEAAR